MSEEMKYDPTSDKPSRFLGNWADGSIADKEEAELKVADRRHELSTKYLEIQDSTKIPADMKEWQLEDVAMAIDELTEKPDSLK